MALARLRSVHGRMGREESLDTRLQECATEPLPVMPFLNSGAKL